MSVPEIGFTGTSKGMTERQRVAVSSLLTVLESNHVHHGDCIGADEEFHEIARGLGMTVELHPPSNPAKRAFCKADTKWPEYEYLTRNKHIVDSSHILIATPQTKTEVQRSGTWSTVRYARKQHKRIFIIQPGGKIIEDAEV
jgi:hypothetical protein